MRLTAAEVIVFAAAGLFLALAALALITGTALVPGGRPALRQVRRSDAPGPYWLMVSLDCAALLVLAWIGFRGNR